MEPITLLHLRPTLSILREALGQAGVSCRVAGGGEERRFQAARLYAPGMALAPEVLYVLRPEHAAHFPGHRFACAGAEPPRADAGCLACPDAPAEALLDALLVAFMRFQDIEARIDALVYRGGSLQELCEMGAELLDNPICVHDDWFVMIARSRELPQVLKPDTVMTSTREFIPRIVLEDFQGDADYLETYAHRTAQLWDATPDVPASLYVNLWEGAVYRGRLLVVRHHRDFLRLDFAVAELLAQRALMLMAHRQLGQDRPYRSMDDIVFDLLKGSAADPQETRQLLDLLGWSRDDKLICARLESQDRGEDSMREHALHSDLFQVFPEGYILFAGRQQCLLLNHTRRPDTLPMLRHRLAPLCRDYCLYAGISAPVTGPNELNAAWLQAGAALERAFRRRSEQWIVPFPECTLEYLTGQLQPPMKPGHLIAPELLRLKAWDAKHDTPYFQTLRAWLLNERDIPRTAQALIIHRTTLLYRLKKLEAIAPMNLDDPDTRLRLLLSLWLMEREG